ncbi:MAG: hypothetical protein L3J07_04475 [Candidatus Magasanikbacteria bacterium]|nr:hypothetical protein [Candidatus Magasanikbacteria bacterium]
MTTFWIIFFYILLVDSVGANAISWFGVKKWYKGNFSIMARYFPATKGWTIYYFVLVLVIGYLIHNYVATLF